MITEKATDQHHNGNTSIIQSFSEKHNLHQTAIGHLFAIVNNIEEAVIRMINNHKIIEFARKTAIDPRQTKEQFAYCLISGKATLRRMATDSEGKDVMTSKMPVKQAATFVGLYNYKTHQNNQFLILQCDSGSKLIQMKIPSSLSHATYLANSHKMSFISSIFPQGARISLHTFMSHFKENNYSRGVRLVEEGSELSKLIIVKEGTCIYSKMLKINNDSKNIDLFLRGPRSIIAAELLTPNKTSQFTLTVQSSTIRVFECQSEDIANLPQSMLNHLTEQCSRECQMIQNICSDKIIKQQITLRIKSNLKEEDKQASKSGVEIGQNLLMKKEEFDPELSCLMTQKVREEKLRNVDKKVAIGIFEMTRSKSSFERVSSILNILKAKKQQKQIILKSGSAKKLDINTNIVEAFQHKKDDKKQLIVKNQIEKYSHLLDRKKKIVQQQLTDNVPLILLKEESLVGSKAFKLKMFRKGFDVLNREPPVDCAWRSDFPKGIDPMDIKMDNIKKEYIKKINETNKIKEQCLTIKSGVEREEHVQLQVLKGYQSMKELQKRGSTARTSIDEDTDYGMLLKLLQKSHRKEESLERVHQRMKFIGKRTMTPYNHEDHLRDSARLRRTSVSSLKRYRKEAN